jgi:hypothetical protein
MYTLKAGTTLYHGTSSADFDEESSNPSPYSWFSTSRSVAERFAKRNPGSGGVPRVLEYCFIGEVPLPEITSARQMQQFAEEHHIDLSGPDAMRSSAEAAGLPGWIVPSNYPDGDDILIADTFLMDYLGTIFVGNTPTAASLTQLADLLEASAALLHSSAYAAARSAEKLFRRLVRSNMEPVRVDMFGMERLVAELRRLSSTVANSAGGHLQAAATMIEELGNAGLCV